MILYNSMSGLRGPLVGHKVRTSDGHKCQSQLLEVTAQRLVRKCEDKRNIKNPKVVSGFGDTNQMKSKWCVLCSAQSILPRNLFYREQLSQTSIILSRCAEEKALRDCFKIDLDQHH